MIADIINKQREIFVNLYHKKYEIHPTDLERIADWWIHEEKQILQALIEREEKLKIRQINEVIGDYAIRLTKYHPVVRISDIAQTGFDVSKQDTIDYLKSEIANINN